MRRKISRYVIMAGLMVASFGVLTGCIDEEWLEDTEVVEETTEEITTEEETEEENLEEQETEEATEETTEAVTIERASDAAPDFTAQVNDGSTFVLSEQTGKVVLLNFWATWCGPCVGEMPAFEQLASEYGDEVCILAVNCMEDQRTVDSFISEMGYTFPVAYDENGDINMKYPTDGIPYTLVLAKDGTVFEEYVGAYSAQEQYEEYKSAIEAALKE